MKNKELTEFDLLIESHLPLERQGPGSNEMTLKALSFVGTMGASAKIADIGCGTGTQTITLAKNTAASVIGVDMVQDFIDVFNTNVKNAALTEKMQGIVGDALKLPFEKEEFDLIWSEGMIDSLGFEKTLSYWNQFIKKGGYVAVTSPSWLTSSRPAEINQFWLDAGSALFSIESNIEAMQKAGYSFVAAFTLPEECWTDCYFIPRMASESTLLQKYPANPMVQSYVKSMKHEVDLYLKHKKDYGYVFYVGKKVE